MRMQPQIGLRIFSKPLILVKGDYLHSTALELNLFEVYRDCFTKEKLTLLSFLGEQQDIFK